MSAVRRVEAGESPEAVVAGLGMNRRTLYRWLAAYHYGGEAFNQAWPLIHVVIGKLTWRYPLKRFPKKWRPIPLPR